MTTRSLAMAVAGAGIAAAAALLMLRGTRDAGQAARLYEQARILEREGKIEDALARYRAALARDPEAIAINRDYQNLMRRAGKLEEARVEYRKRAAGMPASPSAQYLAARLEDGDALEKGMLRAIQLDAGFIWPHRALGQYYRESGRVDDAIRHLRLAVESPGPDLDDARVLIGYLYLQTRYDDIDRLIADWGSRRPAFAPPADPAVALPLGRAREGVVARLHVGLDAESCPYIFQIACSRESDGLLRLVTVRKTSTAYAVARTPRWMKPEEAAGAPAEWSESAKRPTFAQAHSIALEAAQE